MTTSSPTARFCPSNQFTKITRTSALCRYWLRFQIWVLSAQPLQKITRTHQDKHTIDEISVCWIVVSFPSKLREQQTHADFGAFHLENHPNSKFDAFLTEKSRYSKNLQQIFNGFWVSTPSFFQGRGISAAITKMASDMRCLHKILKSCQEKDSSFNHIHIANILYNCSNHKYILIKILASLKQPNSLPFCHDNTVATLQRQS